MPEEIPRICETVEDVLSHVFIKGALKTTKKLQTTPEDEKLAVLLSSTELIEEFSQRLLVFVQQQNLPEQMDEGITPFFQRGIKALLASADFFAQNPNTKNITPEILQTQLSEINEELIATKSDVLQILWQIRNNINRNKNTADLISEKNTNKFFLGKEITNKGRIIKYVQKLEVEVVFYSESKPEIFKKGQKMKVDGKEIQNIEVHLDGLLLVDEKGEKHVFQNEEITLSEGKEGIEAIFYEPETQNIYLQKEGQWFLKGTETPLPENIFVVEESAVKSTLINLQTQKSASSSAFSEVNGEIYTSPEKKFTEIGMLVLNEDLKPLKVEGKEVLSLTNNNQSINGVSLQQVQTHDGLYFAEESTGNFYCLDEQKICQITTQFSWNNENWVMLTAENGSKFMQNTENGEVLRYNNKPIVLDDLSPRKFNDFTIYTFKNGTKSIDINSNTLKPLEYPKLGEIIKVEEIEDKSYQGKLFLVTAKNGKKAHVNEKNELFICNAEPCVVEEGSFRYIEQELLYKPEEKSYVDKSGNFLSIESLGGRKIDSLSEEVIFFGTTKGFNAEYQDDGGTKSIFYDLETTDVLKIKIGAERELIVDEIISQAYHAGIFTLVKANRKKYLVNHSTKQALKIENKEVYVHELITDENNPSLPKARLSNEEDVIIDMRNPLKPKIPVIYAQYIEELKASEQMHDGRTYKTAVLANKQEVLVDIKSDDLDTLLLPFNFDTRNTENITDIVDIYKSAFIVKLGEAVNVGGKKYRQAVLQDNFDVEKKFTILVEVSTLQPFIIEANTKDYFVTMAASGEKALGMTPVLYYEAEKIKTIYIDEKSQKTFRTNTPESIVIPQISFMSGIYSIPRTKYSYRYAELHNEPGNFIFFVDDQCLCQKSNEKYELFTSNKSKLEIPELSKSEQKGITRLTDPFYKKILRIGIDFYLLPFKD